MNNLGGEMVSRIEYDEKEQECLGKDEQIQVSDTLLLIYFIHYLNRFYKRRFVVWNIYYI